MWLIVGIVFIVCVIVKSIRYYIISFFFPFLYDHPFISQFIGIKYVNDTTFRPERKDVRIYLAGVFAKLFSYFTGLPIITSDETRKELMRLQGLYAKDISMKYYFDKLFNETTTRKMTLIEFEEFLADCILTETNRVFKILNTADENIIRKHLQCIRIVLAGLKGGENRSIMQFIRGLSAIRQTVKILHNHSPSHRLLILIPCLTLIDGFSKMIVQKTNNELEMKDFFDFTSRFFVVVYKGDLTFINRSKDDSNNSLNRAFGVPKGFLCPGNIYVTKFIKSIIEFLNCLDITVDGTANISNKRFRSITNMKDISLTFKLLPFISSLVAHKGNKGTIKAKA